MNSYIELIVFLETTPIINSMTKLSKAFNCSKLKNKTNSRVRIIAIFLLLILFGTIYKLATLQIYKHQEFLELSNNNHIYYLPFPPSRGQIFDKNGVLLVTNQPMFTLDIIPNQVINMNNLISSIKSFIDITDKEIKSFEAMRKHKRKFHFITLKHNLTEMEVVRLTLNLHKLTGVYINTNLRRKYLYNSLLSHTLGVIGKITPKEILDFDKSNYSATSVIGKNGIEKQYESLLHGTVGYQKVMVNAYDKVIKVLEQREPIPGNDIYLTIDINLQQEAEKNMQKYSGALVAIDTTNGGVLAMASSPGFSMNNDHNNSNASSTSNYSMFNRCINGLYPIASTIKPFLSLEALDKDIVNSKYSIYDRGWFKLPNSNHIFKDVLWRQGGQGWVNISQALIISNDTYFYNLASLMGIDMINNVMKTFEFGDKTKIDLPNESVGLVPHPTWKLQVKNEKWYGGDTVLIGIGQGFFLATPLQLANATMILANRGKYHQVHILDKVNYTNNNTIISNYVPTKAVTFKQSSWETVINSLTKVTTIGTGRKFGNDHKYSVAAKTGTGQVINTKNAEKYSIIDLPTDMKDNSIFIAFAPAHKPKIAIAIIIENNNCAAVIARNILDCYFNNIT